ncbi:unnamed protein product [Bursaphelenchus xylophilus]|uniref:(pine wood nematode) hypothetical protein n=1 Tax=Bursaphelenchus xylophilus TaxID=6326 RepID=A0A1I7RWT7_BURXY|nr:unnamed protein product [Bursaphelenchus xylophilus]CAG9128670.1 unnamed protein product [Bursaphelenchus xylophilus]
MLGRFSLATETLSSNIPGDDVFKKRMKIAYYNRNRHGRIRRQIVERYVRNDAHCGLMACNCNGGTSETKKIDPVTNQVQNKVMNLPHVVIVDSQVLWKFLDIFVEGKIENVIIPYSAWRTIKQRNRKAFAHLQDLYGTVNDNYFLFNNEFFVETLPEEPLSQTDGESILIAKMANYLLEHWRGHKVVPVVLTADETALDQIKGLYRYSTTFLSYVRGFPKSDDKKLLVQRVKELGKVEEKGGKNPHYPYYMTERELDTAVREGTVRVGKFMVTMENRQEAYVQVNDTLKVLVHGVLNMNRAITGDSVAVYIFPESKWRAPEGRFRTQEVEEEKKEEFLEEEDEEKKNKKKENAVPTGRVVSIVKRQLKHYCGILEPPNVKNGSRCIFRPADRRLPSVIIDTRAYEMAIGKKVLASIVRWPADSWLPQGSLVRVIGQVGDKDAENEVILLEHDVRFRDFTEEERAELPRADWKPASPLEPYRRDLTYLDICSVDPVGCTDIDDALHFRELSKGRYEVGVHIADVSHFVRAGSPLDLEASRRCTTVYLCGRRIDMLPERLSSHLCSLREHELRYAFSVIWELDENADIQRVEFTKSLIKSRRAFTYEQAQQLVDKKDDQSVLALSLRGLMKLSKIMRERRRNRGSLTLASMEIRFDFDEKTGNPIGVSQKQSLDTMSMVEEFMLLANVSVAERVLHEFPGAAMLRRHPVPNQEAFKPLLEAAAEMGLEIKTDNNKVLAESLDKAVDPKNPKANQMLRMMATRCMTQALYFPAGTIPADQYRHYGLAIPIYTHFTSPIRRYADVVVHRQLATLLGVFKNTDMPKMFSRSALVFLSDEMNRKNRLAQRANRASVVLNTQFLLNNKPAEDDGFVTQLKENGVLVVVPKYGVDSVVEFPPGCNVKLALFQKVKVRLSVEETNQRRFLRMQIIDPDLAEGAGDAEPTESFI